MGVQPSTTIAARMPTGTSIARSAYDPARIAVLHVVGGLARPTPHLQVMNRQEPAFGILALPDLGQIGPRHGRVFVVGEMPIVVQPQAIDWRPHPQIAGALEHMTR